MDLRHYQTAAVEAVYAHLRAHEDNPCVVIPTAGGKTPVMATICKDAVTIWGGRVLIVAHVRELLEQSVDKLRLICPEVQVGIYSAGLGSRDTLSPVIVAGVQSAFRNARELGRFDLVLVDEAHMIPPDGEGMYRTLITELQAINPLLRVIGFTATPFRMSTGTICAPENILNDICYEISVRELIAQGYICPLKTKAGTEKADTSGLHIRGGEFIAAEVEALMDTNRLVASACAEIIRLTQDRKSVLIFASGIEHGKHIAENFELAGQRAEYVFGETLDFERDRILDDFKAGRLKYLINVGVLTQGFDAPCCDCVALVRPTQSPGLYYQMVGRGFRLHPGKQDCLVLDFGGNAMRHGPVDALRLKTPGAGTGVAPQKECPACHLIIAAGCATCPECGYEWPKPERELKHGAEASTASVLAGETTDTICPVARVAYAVHTKKNAPENAPKTMRVSYMIGWQRWQSEWVCFEHFGFAREKAEKWWYKRSQLPVPETAADAVALAEAGALAETKSITVRHVSGEEYDRIVAWELGPRPGAQPEPDANVLSGPEPEYAPAEDAVPF